MIGINLKIDKNKVKRNFLTGLGILGPVGITLYVIVWIIEKIGGIFTNIIGIFPILNKTPYIFRLFLSLLLVIALIYATGAYVGQSVKKFIDAIFSRVPLVRSIYHAITRFTEQFMEAIMKQEKEKKDSKRFVVLVKFPHLNAFSMGFITQKEPIKVGERKIYKVFVPTTPNPTSGFLLFTDEENIRFLDLTSEEAIRIIVSGGMGQDKESLAKIQQALK